SLVCQSWLVSSRMHLFRNVVLTPENLGRIASFISESPFAIPPYVKWIELRNVDSCFTRRSSTLELLADLSSTITHLNLFEAAFDTLLDLLDVVCSFPYLQFVGLDLVRLARRGTPPHQRVAIQKRVLPPFVDHISLQNSSFGGFLLWIISHVKLPRVSRFETAGVQEVDGPYFAKYLSLLGSDLKHVSFSISYGSNGHIC
ncbi:hypothetical protein BDZ97DRAFT_1599317, partial [Flammula alnicola]